MEMEMWTEGVPQAFYDYTNFYGTYETNRDWARGWSSWRMPRNEPRPVAIYAAQCCIKCTVKCLS